MTNEQILALAKECGATKDLGYCVAAGHLMPMYKLWPEELEAFYHAACKWLEGEIEALTKERNLNVRQCDANQQLVSELRQQLAEKMRISSPAWVIRASRAELSDGRERACSHSCR